MRRRDTVTFTREQLYKLVWSKPMTEIAAEFGMSSNAFMKHCERADVPRPGRGHWQQVATGYTPPRERLPKAGPDTPGEIEITKHEPRRPLPGGDIPVPKITVPESLKGAHPLVGQIQQRLRAQGGIHGDGHAVLSADGEARRRALLILDALFKGLALRGHAVRLEGAPGGGGREALNVYIKSRPAVELWLIEHLDRSHHAETPEEQERRARFGFNFAPSFDYKASGRLFLEVKTPWGAELRKRWADGKKQRIEDLLGEIVVGIERAAEAWKLDEQRRELERRQEQRRQARWEAAERRRAHMKALAQDLRDNARVWRETGTMREFLEALEAKVPDHLRNDTFTKWLAWAHEHVESVDPLGKPEQIAKPLTPRGTAFDEGSEDHLDGDGDREAFELE